MAIDPKQETLYPLSIAVKFAPRSSRTGNYLHPSVLYRWSKIGLLGPSEPRRLLGPSAPRIYLETLKAGGVVTSREAIARFLEKRSGLADVVSEQSPPRKRTDSEEAQARVARELDSAGI